MDGNPNGAYKGNAKQNTQHMSLVIIHTLGFNSFRSSIVSSMYRANKTVSLSICFKEN